MRSVRIRAGRPGLFEDDHPNVGLHFKRWSLEKDFLNGRAHTPRISAAISSISVWEMVHLWGAEGPPKRYQIGALAWEDDSIGWIAETFGAVFDFLTGFEHHEVTIVILGHFTHVVDWENKIRAQGQFLTQSVRNVPRVTSRAQPSAIHGGNGDRLCGLIRPLRAPLKG